ncbi:hypothetical protein [Alcaligenes aquatilis]|nr:hypothetical protein [Alcaligenes aquatilis]
MHYSSYHKLYSNFIIEINALLANRLRGSTLERAQSIVRLALTELGGGQRRVEQRLRSTLEWCRDPNYRRLMFDSSPKEIALSWMYRDPAHSPCRSAAAHHKEHAQRLQFIAHELRLSRDQRKGLVRAAERTAASAARLRLENTSKKENQRLRTKGVSHRVDYVKADQWRRCVDHERQVRRYSASLIQLQREGWIVCFQTIVLPEPARPTLSRSNQWGLAGSPDAAHGTQILRQIQRASLPAKAVSKRLGGFWALQSHDSDQVHQHGLIAFRDQQELDAYWKRLNESYANRTLRLRSFKVIGAFGVHQEVGKDSIDLRILSNEDDIKRTVLYSMREFGREVNLIPAARRHAAFGALTIKKPKPTNESTCEQQSEEKQSGDRRIKHFPGPQVQTKTLCVSHFSTLPANRILFDIVVLARRHMRPPVRAPPTNFNAFQGRSIAVRCSYSIRYFLNGAYDMTRKTPQEQIAAARAALARAQARQRQHDTRSKIILGGYILSWVRSDVDAAKKLLLRLNSAPPREQDRDALAIVRDELRSILRNCNDVGGNGNA